MAFNLSSRFGFGAHQDLFFFRLLSNMDDVTEMIVDYLSSWSQNQELNNKQQNQTLTIVVHHTIQSYLKVGIRIVDVGGLYSRP